MREQFVRQIPEDGHWSSRSREKCTGKTVFFGAKFSLGRLGQNLVRLSDVVVNLLLNVRAPAALASLVRFRR